MPSRRTSTTLPSAVVVPASRTVVWFGPVRTSAVPCAPVPTIARTRNGLEGERGKTSSVGAAAGGASAVEVSSAGAGAARPGGPWEQSEKARRLPPLPRARVRAPRAFAGGAEPGRGQGPSQRPAQPVVVSRVAARRGSGRVRTQGPGPRQAQGRFGPKAALPTPVEQRRERLAAQWGGQQGPVADRPRPCRPFAQGGHDRSRVQAEGQPEQSRGPHQPGVRRLTSRQYPARMARPQTSRPRRPAG